MNYETANETCSEQVKEAEETLLISRLPCNIHKNRYKDVLPIGFDGVGSTRVRLSAIRGLDGSDFINANLLMLDKERSYISCQAPVPHTIGDFWRMVWEQNSSVVVMLTRLVENDRIKAHTYWPPLGHTHSYGLFSVAVTEETEDLGIIIRQIHLTRLEDESEVRVVTHLHFCDWPDNGAPRTCLSTCRLLQVARIYRAIHKERQGLAGPAVVHCSAGIGRSGTFIAIDMLLDRVLQSQRVRSEDDFPKTVFEAVRWLRLRRRGMIQSLDQYKFIFRVLEEFKERIPLSDEDEEKEIVTASLISCHC